MKRITIMSLPKRVEKCSPKAETKTKAIVQKLVKPALITAALLAGQNALAATCSYSLLEEWNSGFKAEIAINNSASTPINNWSVSWEWADGSSYNNGWNADYTCTASSCTATGPSWAQSIAANQIYTFGLVGNKGTAGAPAATSVTINGAACDGTTPPPPPPPNEPSVLWSLDAAQSNIQYVSTKNEHNSEVNKFTQGTDGSNALSGTIDSTGQAVLSIDLNDVDTGIAIRNERMRNFVFETNLLPTAYITVALDTNALSTMAAGSSARQTLNGDISLHGVSQAIEAEVLVTKTSATNISVATLKPILVDSKDFDFASGIEVLRTVANLAAIGEAVPVYFRLNYVANTSVDVTPIAIAERPAAPSVLAGSYNQTAGATGLTWQDNSTNETGFIVRRRSATAAWATVADVLQDVASYTDAIAEDGTYDYKVIALNGSIASAPSNVLNVVVSIDPNNPPDPVDPVVSGRDIYTTQCIACHGASGEGVGSFPPVNIRRDIAQMSAYIAEFMPLGTPTQCDQKCADDVSAYIATFWDNNPPDPDPNPGGSACRADQPTTYGARQLKILTRSEYQRSVEDLIGIDFDAAAGLSEDDKIGLFANNTHSSIVSSSYSNFLLVAEQIAEWSAARDFAPALSCTTVDQGCANSLVNDLAPRIFRRPLTTDEAAAYQQIANGTSNGGDIKAGMTLALEAMLSAPQFLYRHELGEPNPDNPKLAADAFELTSYEMATFLAYTFTGSTPDQELLTAASNDLLRNDVEILQQAVRLAEASTAKEIMGNFVGSWLGTDSLDVAAKDPTSWPGFSALVPHMKNEIRENFASVMLDPQESFSSLYDANYSFINQTLANHYGIPGVVGNQMRRVATTDRGGILANGAFMARWGEAVESSPILRSVRVRRRMLCQDELPDPPAGTFAARDERLAQLSDILRDPTTTNRRKFHLLTEGQPCSACHLEYINPLGFGMEDFDTVGNIRSTDLKGNAIDAAGELFAPLDYNDRTQIEVFSGAKDLGRLISTLPSAQSCLSEQMFRYVMGVGHENIDTSNPEAPDLAPDERAGYACEIENLTNAMINTSPRSMLERFSTLEAVRYRKAWPRN